jgi:hypothetical protein
MIESPPIIASHYAVAATAHALRGRRRPVDFPEKRS